MVGTADGALTREVPLIQSVLHREISLNVHMLGIRDGYHGFLEDDK